MTKFPFPRRIQGILLVVVLLATLITGAVPAIAQARAGGAPQLFGDASGADASLAGGNAAFVMRSRLVKVNTGLLLDTQGQALTSSTIPEITLNLFPNANYIGVVDSVEKGALNSTSWSGTLRDKPGSYFYLVMMPDRTFIAHVASVDGIYEVSSVGGDVYKMIQIDHSKFADDPNSTGALIPDAGVSLDLPSLTAGNPTADSGSSIDIMVVYTGAALAGEPGATSALKLAALKARIALAVKETNASYANAGITPRLRLVHIQKVSYAESGDLSVDVARLANTSDGFMDGIHSVRDTFGADMVSLVVENGGGFCGMADAIMADATTAFQVTARNGCMTGYYSFGHEFGHLQGARHDMYADPTLTPYANGHGYVHTGSSASTRWRTVMAYDSKCNSLGYNCTRLQYWSNSGVTHGGAAMGDADSENYTVLNATAATVANFRTAVISPAFNSSFNSNSNGWTPITGNWPLASSAYLTTSGVTNSWSSIAHSGTYGDFTFEARMMRTGCTGCSNSLWIRGNSASLDPMQAWQPSFEFTYSNVGTFSVWKIDGLGNVTAVKNWTTNPAITPGTYNTLKVVAVGTSFKFYINNTLVWSGSNSSFPTGQVGLAMFRPSTGSGNKLTVDWAKLTNTPTADLNINEEITPGIEIPGGSHTRSPKIK